MLPVCNQVMLFNKSQWYYFCLYCTAGLLLLLHMLLSCFTLYIAFRVILYRHSQSLYEELTVWFVSSGAAVHGPNFFGPLPHPKIHHRNYIKGVPIHARNCLCPTDLGCSKKGVFTLYSSQKCCTGLP